MRTLALLAVIAFASPSAAVEVVLRDTIGCDANGENCDSTATDDVSAVFANTNNGTLYSSPGLRFSNPSARAVRLRKVGIVIIAQANGQPLNDPSEIYNRIDMRMHFWSGGIENDPNSFDARPNLGTEELLLDETNSSLTELGFTSSTQGVLTTYVLSSDVGGEGLIVSPGQELVYSVMQRLVTQTDFSMGVLWSRTFFGVQDVFQTENSLPEDRPGFLNAQLGFPVGSFAGFVSAEFLEGDYNGDGVVDAADYPVWRDNLGETGLDAWAPGDGNGDGDITLADYDVWRSQYGMTLADLATPPGSSLSVPEPGALALTALALLSIARRRNPTSCAAA